MNYHASTLTAAPVYEPLTIAEVKDHLRIEDDVIADDAYLAALIKAARSWAEGYTGRAFITQTWETRFDTFGWEMELPHPPLRSVSSVKYLDANGTEQTVATTVYDVDTTSVRGRIWLAYSQSWPTPRVIQHAVRITHVAGYGANGSDVPEDVRLGMLLLIGAWYENREPVVVGASVAALPAPVSVPALLMPYCVHRP